MKVILVEMMMIIIIILVGIVVVVVYKWMKWRCNREICCGIEEADSKGEF